MDDTYVLTGSDDNTVKLYDRRTGVCLHSLQPDLNFNIVNKPYILVSPVTAVIMNDRYIAIGYKAGEMHLYDKTNGELLGMLNVASKERSQIDKIIFAKFDCDIYPDGNCYMDDEEVDVIITVAGGLVSVVFEDVGDVERQKQNSI